MVFFRDSHLPFISISTLTQQKCLLAKIEFSGGVMTCINLNFYSAAGNAVLVRGCSFRQTYGYTGFQPKIHAFPSLHLKNCGSGGTAYDHALTILALRTFFKHVTKRVFFCGRHKSSIIDRLSSILSLSVLLLFEIQFQVSLFKSEFATH